MSVFMVSDRHVDAMLTAGLESDPVCGPLAWDVPGEGRRDTGPSEGGEVGVRRTLTPETAGWVGAMLLAENRRSVNERYSEDEIEGPYVFRPFDAEGGPAAVLKLVACYRYQSCEHEGWEGSEAMAFCDALTDALVRRLPGYKEAPWSIEEDAGRRPGAREGERSAFSGDSMGLTTQLGFTRGTSDKVYRVTLAKEGGGFVVKAEWGRRGNLNQSQEKYRGADRAEAERIRDGLLAAKRKKGYADEGAAA